MIMGHDIGGVMVGDLLCVGKCTSIRRRRCPHERPGIEQHRYLTVIGTEGVLGRGLRHSEIGI